MSAGGMPEAQLVSLEEAQAARERIFAPEVRRAVLRTPLVALNWDFDDERQIYLKLESLQQISSFKIRGAMNAILCKDLAALKANGVVTASAGNMGQGAAYGARQLGFSCTVVVPDSAPATKLEAMERLGAKIVRVPYEEWWAVLMNPSLLKTKHQIMGEFIHPVVDRNVMAGHASIGIELVEDLGADLDCVVIAYGGGGLTCGVASALRALCTSGVKVYTVEPETACPVHDAFANGKKMDVASPQRYRPSFVDGCGGKSVIPAMWPVVSQLADDALSVSLADIEFAIKV